MLAHMNLTTSTLVLTKTSLKNKILRVHYIGRALLTHHLNNSFISLNSQPLPTEFNIWTPLNLQIIA